MQETSPPPAPFRSLSGDRAGPTFAGGAESKPQSSAGPRIAPASPWAPATLSGTHSSLGLRVTVCSSQNAQGGQGAGQGPRLRRPHTSAPEHGAPEHGAGAAGDEAKLRGGRRRTRGSSGTVPPGCAVEAAVGGRLAAEDVSRAPGASGAERERRVPGSGWRQEPREREVALKTLPSTSTRATRAAL